MNVSMIGMSVLKFLSEIERVAANFQGKGWGSDTTLKEVRAIKKILGREKVRLVVDIGGNQGDYSKIVLKNFPGTKLFIFEPDNMSFKKLKERFKGNAQVFIENLAVSNHTGEVPFYTNQAGSTLGSLYNRRVSHLNITFNETQKAKCIKFEKFWSEKLQEKTVDLCKIDIEGHELEALQGFGNALQHIKTIQFEFGKCNIDSRTYFQDFWYFFKENGFEIHRITALGPKKIHRYNELDEFFLTTNYIAKNVHSIV